LQLLPASSSTMGGDTPMHRRPADEHVLSWLPVRSCARARTSYHSLQQQATDAPGCGGSRGRADRARRLEQRP
jgi:hypothetical protein